MARPTAGLTSSPSRHDVNGAYASVRGSSMITGTCRGAVLLPPRILLETTVDIALPLLPLQLTGPHRDCRSFPGDHHARMCAQVVIPTGISGRTIVGGDHNKTITVRQTQHRERAGLSRASTSCRQHYDRQPRDPR